MGEVIVDAYEGNCFTTNGRKKSKDPETAEAGFQGLYEGLEMQIIKGFLSQGVTSLVRERQGYTPGYPCLSLFLVKGGESFGNEITTRLSNRKVHSLLELDKLHPVKKCHRASGPRQLTKQTRITFSESPRHEDDPKKGST
jgi:hypothetical protein